MSPSEDKDLREPSIVSLERLKKLRLAPIWERSGDAREQLWAPAGGELRPVSERSSRRPAHQHQASPATSGERETRLPGAGATSSQAVGARVRRFAAPTATAYLPSAVQFLRNVGVGLRRDIRWRGLAILGATLRRSGDQHSGRWFLAGPGHLHHLQTGGVGRIVQLYLEFLPRGLYKRRL